MIDIEIFCELNISRHFNCARAEEIKTMFQFLGEYSRSRRTLFSLLPVEVKKYNEEFLLLLHLFICSFQDRSIDDVQQDFRFDFHSHHFHRGNEMKLNDALMMFVLVVSRVDGT